MQWSCTFGPWGHSRVVIADLCSFLAFVFFFLFSLLVPLLFKIRRSLGRMDSLYMSCVMLD